MVLGNPVKRLLEPQRGHNPQVVNSWSIYSMFLGLADLSFLICKISPNIERIKFSTQSTQHYLKYQKKNIRIGGNIHLLPTSRESIRRPFTLCDVIILFPTYIHVLQMCDLSAVYLLGLKKSYCSWVGLQASDIKAFTLTVVPQIKVTVTSHITHMFWITVITKGNSFSSKDWKARLILEQIWLTMSQEHIFRSPKI